MARFRFRGFFIIIKKKRHRILGFFFYCGSPEYFSFIYFLFFKDRVFLKIFIIRFQFTDITEASPPENSKIRNFWSKSPPETAKNLELFAGFFDIKKKYFNKKYFVINCILITPNKIITSKILINIGNSGHVFINSFFAHKYFLFLFFLNIFRILTIFDGRETASDFIIYVIYFNLRINKYIFY